MLLHHPVTTQNRARGQANSLTCTGSLWPSVSLRHSSTLTPRELYCSTGHTRRATPLSACSPFLVPCRTPPGAAEIHSCSRSQCSSSLLHPTQHPTRRTPRMLLPLRRGRGRNGRPSRGAPPQTAGQTKRRRETGSSCVRTC